MMMNGDIIIINSLILLVLLVLLVRIIIRATYGKYHKNASQNWSWLLKLNVFIVFFLSSEGSIVSGITIIWIIA